MKRFSESRMREIRTSGSMRGERAAPYVSSVLLLYREYCSLLPENRKHHLCVNRRWDVFGKLEVSFYVLPFLFDPGGHRCGTADTCSAPMHRFCKPQ